MPIRLNLLAEAQAAEELRRRDPVKRAIWIGALLVALMLVWSSSLKFKAMLVTSELGRIESQIQSRAKDYQVILNDQNKTAEILRKLAGLRQLSSQRLLQGNLLNALQYTTVDDVQLTRLRVDQLYSLTEGTKSKTNDVNVVIPGRPPTSTEKVTLTLEGTDTSANPGDQLNRFKDTLATNSYFKQVLASANAINLRNLAPPAPVPLTGKRGVLFTLECRYPEKTR